MIIVKFICRYARLGLPIRLRPASNFASLGLKTRILKRLQYDNLYCITADIQVYTEVYCLRWIDMIKFGIHPRRVGYPVSPSVKPWPCWAADVFKTGILELLQYTMNTLKTSLACIYFAFIVLCSGNYVFSASPVEKHGLLVVKDGKLRDKNGNVVVLRGMSLFWSQWMPQFYNKNTVDWLVKDWNVNVIRAAMAVESQGYLRNPDREKAKIFAVIDACIEQNIYVIVDWHDHNAVDHEKQAIEFFKEIATKYGTHPHLIYETYNEPLNTHTWPQIKKYHEAVVAEIRKIDPDNLILLGSSWWDQAVDEASKDPLEGFANLAYTFHFYTSDRNHQQKLRDQADTAIKNGLCLFISECGVSESSGNGDFDTEKTDLWFDWAERNEISWCVWSIADKNETSAALLPGASKDGGWKIDELTPGGKYIREKIRALNVQ